MSVAKSGQDENEENISETQSQIIVILAMKQKL